MPTFSPNPVILPLSPGRGVRAQASASKDSFQDVFRSRLLARLSSRKSILSQPTRKVAPGTRQSLATTQESSEKGHSWARAALKNRNPGAEQSAVQVEGSGSPVRQRKGLERGSGQKTQKQPGAENAVLGLGPGDGATATSLLTSRSESTSTSPPMPLLLKEFMAFLATLPDQTLKVQPEQAKDLAALLLSAGLPQEEVERLLFTPTSLEKGLSLADVQAAWQRVQETMPSQISAKGAVQPSTSEFTLPEEAQELLQSREYQRVWERLTLPKSELPVVRLALARLGASPEDLAQLDEEAAGQDIPLSRIWQILQNCQKPASVPTGGEKVQLPQGETPSQANLLSEQPVIGEEVEEWRQVLLKAGIPAEVVEKVLGSVSPADQEQLKATLLALAPSEKPPPALSEPKPLYLPDGLRLKPFFWQAKANGEQSQQGKGGTGWEGSAAGQNSGMSSSLAGGEMGEAYGVPSFAADLQAAAPNWVGSGAPLAYANPAWEVLTPEVRESLWSQLQSGIITNLGPGETKVNVSLNPPELGQIQLTLHLTGQELSITAVTSRPEVAELANLGVRQLLQTLAQQGIVLTQFQVQPRVLPARQDSFVAMNGRQRGNEPGTRFSNSSRRRTGEVDRFV